MTNDLQLDPTRFSAAAANGLRVFPVLSRGKKPAAIWTEYVHREPSADELRAWDASDLNVGVSCEGSKIIVLDVDSEDAQVFVDELDLPATPVVSTGRGKHYYFKAVPAAVRNSTNIAGHKLDVRGDGGYVVGAGSRHPSGAPYEWVVSPAEVSFADFPEVLLQLLSRPKPTKSASRGEVVSVTATPPGASSATGAHCYVENELAESKIELEAAASGSRNDTLFKVAARLARHCAGAQTDWADIAARIAVSAIKVGLDQGEIEGTLDSAWKAGELEPTQWLRVASEHIYLGTQDMFYHRVSGTDLKPAGFNGVFGHHYGGKGAFAKFLLTNGYVEKVHDIDYCPLRAAGTFERNGQMWFNSFRRSDVVAIEGDASPFVDLVEHLVPNEFERDHLMKMMAFTVRNPGRKLRHALLLRSPVQGVGKSILTDIWGSLLGRSNVRKTNSKELKGDYQGYLPGHLLVVCEELNLGMGLSVYNDLKDLLTGDIATINEKFLRHRDQNIYATFAFLTNRPVPMLIEDTDRRFFFIDSPAEKREPDYYVIFSAWWRAHLGVIRHHLDHVDLAAFNEYSPPPMTTAKQKLIEDSRSELAQDLAHLINSRTGRFDRDIVTLEDVAWELGDMARGKSRIQLSKALIETGAVSLGQQRMAGRGRLSLWCIRNQDYWLFVEPSERAREYSLTTGMFAFLNDACIGVRHTSLWPADPELLLPPKPMRMIRFLPHPDYDWPSNGLAD